MSSDRTGLLIVFSSPSGGGKGTVLCRLMEMAPDVRLSVSATTRNPRPGEEEGKAYFFVSREQFAAMLEKGQMLEHAEFCGNCYGTPSEPIARWMGEGSSVILEIEVQGGGQVIEKRPDCVSIFLLPPSMAVLEQRLRDRNTEDEETIQKRLAEARGEISQASRYHYIVVNDEVDRAAEEILQIIRAEQHRTIRNIRTIEGVLQND